MNPLLREISPTDLQTIVKVRRRLDERHELARRSVDERTEQGRLIDSWGTFSDPEVGHGDIPADGWSVPSRQLVAERNEIARSLDEERRSAAMLREASALLGSFLELLTAGFDSVSSESPTPDKPLDIGEEIRNGPSATDVKPTHRKAQSYPQASESAATSEVVGLGDWRTVAGSTLDEHGPLHYKDLYRRLRLRGVIFGGAHPAGTFLATLNRDTNFVRVGRGIYWLAGRPLPDAALEAAAVGDAKSQRKKAS
jgi:hypothetical protein